MSNKEAEKRAALEAEILRLQQEQREEIGLLDSAREKLLSNQEKELEIIKKRIELGEDALNDAAEQKNVLQQLGASQEDFNALLKQGLQPAEALSVLHKKSVESLEAQKRVSEDIKNGLSGIASQIGITNTGYAKTLKNTGRILGDLQKMGKGKFTANLVTAAADVFSFSNILGSVINKTVEMATATYDMAVEIQKTTGIVGGFREELQTQIGAASDAGVEFTKLGASYQGITTGLIGATADSTGLRKELGLQITQFEQFGVSIDDSVSILNNLSTTMNTDMTESMEIMKDLTLSATQLGLGPKKMAKDFQSASKSLAVHGKKSVEVFKGLAVAARNAGTSVDSLVAIANKFDTFESAADTAGKLNSILGSTMSATEMLMMTEDQRIESLIGTVQASGQAFNQMDRFTQKAIAQAAGISDMSEANRIFGMSLDAYKQQEAEAKKSADAQEKFNKAIDGVVPLATRLAIELQKLGSNAELVDKIIDGMVFAVEAVAVVMDTLANPMGLVISLVAALALKFGAAYLGGLLYGKGMVVAGAGMSAAGAGGSAGAPGVTAFGIAMASAAAAGFPFVGVVLALAVPILALAVAFVAIGYAFKLAFEGFTLFIAEFSKLSLVKMGATVAAVFALGYGFVALAGGLASLANPLSVAGAAVFMKVAIGAGVLAGGIGLLLTGISDFTTKTVEPMFASAEAAKGVAEAVDSISESISNVPNKKLFSATLENIALITTGKSAGITQATEAVADRISNISTTLKNDMKILLEIDGKQFNTVIREVVNGQTGDSSFGESMP